LFPPNEPVEKVLFWLFFASQVFDFINSQFTKNAFSYRLKAKAKGHGGFFAASLLSGLFDGNRSSERHIIR
jgi:hypothetical protein